MAQSSYVSLSMGQVLNLAGTAMLGGNNRPLGITGKPGISKSTLVKTEFVTILKEYYSKALPPYFDEAKALIAEHTKLISHSRGTRHMVGVVRKCLADFADRPKNLRIAYDWLEYALEYGFDELDFQVEHENKRLSQVDSALLAGYPDSSGGRMITKPAPWFPVDKFDRLLSEVKLANQGVVVEDNGASPLGIFCMDEPNRASHDTVQAAFQLLEKGHRIGDWSFKSGWVIVVCMNVGPLYEVNPQDGAWVGRLNLVEMFVDIDTWMKNFGSKRSQDGHLNIHPWVRDFLMANPEFLVASDELLSKAIKSEEKFPSPRDWTDFSTAMYQSKLNKVLGVVGMSLEDDITMMFDACASAVGMHTAIQFKAFVSSMRDVVTPDDILGGDLVSESTGIAADMAKRIGAMDSVDCSQVVANLRSHMMKDSYYLSMSDSEYASMFMFLAVLRNENLANAYKILASGASTPRVEVDVEKEFDKFFLGLHAKWHVVKNGSSYRDGLPFTKKHPLTLEEVNFSRVILNAARSAQTSKE